MKRYSLTLRIAAWLGVVTVLLLGGAALLMDHLVDAEMGQRFDASLVAQARTISALVEIGPAGLNMEELHREPSHLLFGNTHVVYSVRCAGGARLNSKPPPRAYPEGWLVDSMASPIFANMHAGGTRQRAVWFSFIPDSDDSSDAGSVSGSAAAAAAASKNVCSVLLMRSSTQLDEILYAIDVTVLVVPMAALLLVLLLSPLLVRRGLEPLTRLGEGMRDIGPQVPSKRLAPVSTPELQPLVARFNEVLERMEQGMLRERRFAGALAHETRTRLAELRVLVDVERRHPSGRTLKEVLGEVSDIGGELEDTVAGLLLLTRLESGIEQVECKRVDLQALLAHQLERIQPMLDKRHLQVEMETEDPSFTVVSDASLLSIVLGNLLRNAAAYTPEESGFRIHWIRQGISVVNHAPELSAAEVEQLGQRHWRKRRGDAEQHAGLGLSLAGAAAKALGCTLKFRLDREQCLHARLDWSSTIATPTIDQFT